MKLSRQLLMVAVLGLAGCAGRSPAAPAGQPAWLSDLVRQLESQPMANPQQVVWRDPRGGG